MIWEIIGAIAGILSLVFAIYEYLKNKKLKEKIEINKKFILSDLEGINTQLISIMHSIDAIVQIGKEEEATVKMLQNLARISRGNLILVLEQLKEPQSKLKEWRYGKLIESNQNLKTDK